MNISAGQVLLDHLARPGQRPETLQLAIELTLDALLSAPDLDETHLARATTGLIDQPAMLARILAHPAAGRMLWHWILAHAGWTSDLFRVLAKNARARKDPDVRRVLRTYATWRDHDLLEALARSSRGREFVAIVNDLVRHAPDRAIRVLARARPAQKRAVRPAQLVPLLESGDRRIRLKAQTILGQTVRARSR